MKHSYALLSCIVLLSATQFTKSFIEQNFDEKLNALQQTLNMLVTQSNLDPTVAQDILNKTNEINQQLQSNVQQDLMEIQIASGIGSLLEAATVMAKAANQTQGASLLATFKQSAHINTMRTLLIGAYRGNITDPSTYTDPYTESIGFIFNNWLFNIIMQAALTTAAATTYGQSILPQTTTNVEQLIIKIAAAITAQCAWTLEKKLFFLNLYQNAYQSFFQKTQKS